jgi:catechol 2,3-dioxygenase-like lactoylglutathione lyase family enzyme
MVVTLDHLILKVNDREASVRFYTEVMGFGDEGEDGPFSVIRVSPDSTLQLAP